MSRYLWRVVAVVAALAFVGPSGAVGSGGVQRAPTTLPPGVGTPVEPIANKSTGIISVTLVNEQAPAVKHRYITKKFDPPTKGVVFDLSYYDAIGGNYKLRVVCKNTGKGKSGPMTVTGSLAAGSSFAALKEYPLPPLGPGETRELTLDPGQTFPQGQLQVRASMK